MRENELKNSKYYDRYDVYSRLYNKAKSNIKFKSLVDRIIHADNIMLAYRNIKGNKLLMKSDRFREELVLLKQMSAYEIIREVRSRLDCFSPNSVDTIRGVILYDGVK